ncbi:uncharacterized protein [Palaemon carinicauda]|uniref:uncharacterized protein isoform X2 n=1 Tax=Palaemon carinicauda TaxID=392227 RepID=UPI0035B6293D
MGKIKKEYREEKMETYGYTSQTSESSQTSGSSESSSTDSESSGSTGRKRKHIKKKSKYKREKKKRSDTEEEPEYIEREKRKKKKHVKHKDDDEDSSDEEHERSEERKHRSRKHSKHHHRKHKHKHRRHRHHRSEEEYQEKRRGASLERTDNRKEREDWEERKPIYEKGEKERKIDKNGDRRVKKEEKRSKERGESRQVKSKWDEDGDVQYSLNKRIKPDPDAEEAREHSRVRQDREVKKRRDREEGSENGRWGMADVAQTIKTEENNLQDKDGVQRPNMGLSGKLSEDTNTFNGVVIKYSQPPEARKPKRRWRWYIFKGEEDLPFLPLHRQSAYLIGRDRKVADIPTDHPSCSKQHAVLQYRLVAYERDDGTKGRTVKPYILDLESANGTYVNNRRIDPRRFVELIEKDVVKFGYSSREYILLHEGSKGDDADAPDMGVDMSPVSLLRS